MFATYSYCVYVTLFWWNDITIQTSSIKVLFLFLIQITTLKYFAQHFRLKLPVPVTTHKNRALSYYEGHLMYILRTFSMWPPPAYHSWRFNLAGQCFSNPKWKNSLCMSVTKKLTSCRFRDQQNDAHAMPVSS